MTTRANLYVDQGVDYITTLELVTLDGEDFEIGSNTFHCQVRKVYSTKLVFEVDVERYFNGKINVVELTIDKSLTRGVSEGKYQYDVIMRYPSGQETKILEGLMFILPTITRTG
jgi:hypothetical protein